MKDYANISVGKGKTSLSIDDTRSSCVESHHSDHAMLIVIGWAKVKSKRAKLRKAKTKSETVRMKTESTLNCAKVLAMLRERLSEELSSLAKPEDLLDLLQELIKEQSIEQSFPLRSGCWAAHLTCAEKEKIPERKKIYRDFLAKRNTDLKSQLMALNREVKLITKECKVRVIETDLRRFEDLSTKNSVREDYRVLKETLRNYRITWFDRARKSIDQSGQATCSLNCITKRKAMDANLKGQILEETPDEMLNAPTRAETKLAINSKSSGKVPEQSGITAVLLKSLQDQLVPVINASFKNFWEETSDTSKAFKDAKVISLFKKGEKTLPSNYRSIFLLDTEGKIFCKILKNLFERCTDQTLKDLKFGFRAGRSTLQAIWTVRRRMQKARDSRRKLVLIFYDLVKAFDSVDRTTLFNFLRDRSRANSLLNLGHS